MKSHLRTSLSTISELFLIFLVLIRRRSILKVVFLDCSDMKISFHFVQFILGPLPNRKAILPSREMAFSRVKTAKFPDQHTYTLLHPHTHIDFRACRTDHTREAKRNISSISLLSLTLPVSPEPFSPHRPQRKLSNNTVKKINWSLFDQCPMCHD